MKVGRNFHLVHDQIQRSLSLYTFSNVLLLNYDTWLPREYRKIELKQLSVFTV